MCWAFQFIEQLGDVVIAESLGQSHSTWSNNKWLSGRLLRNHQSEPKKTVNHLLKGSSGSSSFPVEKMCYIVIKRKGGSHMT
jgi:fructose/tagatose bisphosphate aldolase